MKDKDLKVKYPHQVNEYSGEINREDIIIELLEKIVENTKP